MNSFSNSNDMNKNSTKNISNASGGANVYAKGYEDEKFNAMLGFRE